MTKYNVKSFVSRIGVPCIEHPKNITTESGIIILYIPAKCGWALPGVQGTVNRDKATNFAKQLEKKYGDTIKEQTVPVDATV